MDHPEDKAWKKYEKHIFKRLTEWANGDVTVEFDKDLPGRFSGIDRQVDVVVSGRFGNITECEITAAVDCKYYSRNIDVKKVDEFVGFVDDLGTELGLLITNVGFTKSAHARAKGFRGIELQVIVAEIDRLPPIHHPAWDESYYVSEYRDGSPFGPDYTVIRYEYLDPDALQYSYDPDNPPEWCDAPVLSGPSDEITWDDDAGRARVIRAVLAHRQGHDPTDEDVDLVVHELTGGWQDGFPWTLYDGQLRRLGV